MRKIEAIIKPFKLDVVVAEERVAAVVDAIQTAACTGGTGDGDILVLALDDVVRIRTGENGHASI